MSRISLTDFSGGIINAANPQSIPDNACTEMLNYEYRDGMYPRKRMGTDSHILNHIAQSGTRAVEVWYSRYMPPECVDDKMYVMVCGTNLYLIYLLSGGAIYQQLMFSDISINGIVTLFPTYKKILVSDGENPGRYISINKDGEIESGNIGIIAPKTILQVSREEKDNSYSEVDTIDIGMGIERGSILQYCYTVEDKYGAESNPSPLTTVTDMIFKYPAESITGYKYYWYKTTIRGLSIDGYESGVRDQLKYYNIYRRAIDYKEGVIGTQFQLYRRVQITPQLTATTDSENTPLRDVSYDKLSAPASSAIIDVNETIFLSGANSSKYLFPFTFEKCVEITLNNLNSIDYVSPVIAIRLAASACNIYGWEQYLSNPTRIRLFFTDMTTPIPVLYRVLGGFLDCYIKPPYLDGNRPTTIYLCLSPEGPGVTDAAWNSYEYGKFCNYEEAWAAQQVFDINRPMDPKHLICTNVPIAYSQITDRTFLYNLSNMDDGKGEITNGGTHYGDNNNSYMVTPYGGHVYIDEAYRYVLPFNGKYVKYTLSNIPKMPITMRLVGSFYALLLGTGGQVVNDLITCGDFRLYAVYAASTGMVYIRARTEAGDGWMGLCSFPWTNLAPFEMSAVIYLTEEKLEFQAFINNEGYHATFPITDEFSLGTFVYLLKDNDSGTSYPSGQYNKITSFDVIESPSYNDAELRRMSFHRLYGLTFFREPLGAIITEAITRNDFANTNITIVPKDISRENLTNHVMWSEPGGNGFSALNFIAFREPVLKIIEAPSFLKMQYQNTIIAMTRNTVNRIPLTSDLKQLGSGAGSVVPEFTSSGLYAPDSLISGGGYIFWLSEAGVMAWSADGLTNITKGILNVPIHDNYIGMWVDRHSQYLLHDKTSRISYVYHTIQRCWTKFIGLNIDGYGKIDMGKTTGNTLLLLYNDRFSVYPGTDVANSTFRITTKQFYIANMRPIRYRVAYDAPFHTATAYTYNEYYGDISDGRSNPPRMKWIMTPNGFWGEFVQISLDGGDGLTRIDIDIKEEL